MIYLVTGETQLFKSDKYSIISVEKSIEIIEAWKAIQFDTETTCLDPHIGKLLTAQFGSPDCKTQIVVDCTTTDIKQYKSLLEEKLLVGHNLKFDLQWLYNYGIHPMKVYCTMIAEKFIYLGYPPEIIGFSLQEVAKRYLNVYISKEVRGQIIWRGLDEAVVLYAAGDVVHLWPIMQKQAAICRKRGAIKGLQIECYFTPVVAYLEWCGIKMDVEKWKKKMQRDQENLIASKKEIDEYIIKRSETEPRFKKFVKVDTQGDLFNGYDLTPKLNLNWNSPAAVEIYKILGFDTTVKDKKTGEDKESALEKHLTMQRGIADDFLRLMFGWDEIDKDGEEIHHWGYKECFKLCTTYGQGHINAINPITGRIHTVYRAIGTLSGRMSSGSKQTNDALAKLKKMFPKDCKYPNMQQLPKDALTRSCFISEKGNLFCSCDYSAKVNFPLI